MQYAPTNWLQVSLDSLNLCFVLYNIMSMYVLFLILRPCFASFAGAKVRRFFYPANFLRVFFKIFLIYFLSGWKSIEIYKRISEGLGETPRGASRTGKDGRGGSGGNGGVRAARAEMGVVGGMGAVGCEPHGQVSRPKIGLQLFCEFEWHSFV